MEARPQIFFIVSPAACTIKNKLRLLLADMNAGRLRLQLIQKFHKDGNGFEVRWKVVPFSDQEVEGFCLLFTDHGILYRPIGLQYSTVHA